MQGFALEDVMVPIAVCGNWTQRGEKFPALSDSLVFNHRGPDCSKVLCLAAERTGLRDSKGRDFADPFRHSTFVIRTFRRALFHTMSIVALRLHRGWVCLTTELLPESSPRATYSQRSERDPPRLIFHRLCGA